MEKILFLGYSFYGYDKEIIEKLSKKYEVYFIDYSLTFYQLLLIKIFGKKLRAMFLKNKITTELEGQEFKYCFVIANQYLDSLIIKKIKKICRIEETILYIWDEIKKIEDFFYLKKEFDKVYSFDRKESVDNGLLYRPTFFSERLKSNNLTEDETISFIGIYKLERLNILNELKKIFKKELFYYLYYDKKFFYINCFLLKKGFNLKMKKNINFKKIDKEEYNKVLKKSKVILDIPEKGQKGMTQRVFDSLYLDKKLITTNVEIENEDFYNLNNIYIIRNELINENEIKSFLNLDYEKNSDQIKYRYSLDGWLEEIFEGNYLK